MDDKKKKTYEEKIKAFAREHGFDLFSRWESDDKFFNRKMEEKLKKLPPKERERQEEEARQLVEEALRKKNK